MDRKTQNFWILGAVAVIVVVVLGFVLIRTGVHTPAVSKPAAQATAKPAPASAGAGEEVGIPKDVTLSTSDPFVRQVTSTLSQNPALVTWLAHKDLVRRFVASVNRIARGKSPRSQLTFLKPRGSFRANKKDDHFVADPRSYQRYDLAVDVFTSLDTRGTVEILHRLGPLMDEAYAEISRPGEHFHDVLESAIIVLLKTPVVPADTPLKEKVVTYAFTDPRLEALSPAQRLLIRTGPKNERRVQAKLRELALALGMTPDRIPEPMAYSPPGE